MIVGEASDIGQIGQAITHLPPIGPVVEVYSPQTEQYIRDVWWYKHPYFVRRYAGEPSVLGSLPAPPPKVVQYASGMKAVVPTPVPPFWGEWGVVKKSSGGCVRACGRVGPFKTIQEAFDAAAKTAHARGATALPGDGWAQVRDSAGQGVGPIT